MAGITAPAEYGGLGMGYTEHCVAMEVSKDGMAAAAQMHCIKLDPQQAFHVRSHGTELNGWFHASCVTLAWIWHWPCARCMFVVLLRDAASMCAVLVGTAAISRHTTGMLLNPRFDRTAM